MPLIVTALGVPLTSGALPIINFALVEMAVFAHVEVVPQADIAGKLPAVSVPPAVPSPSVVLILVPLIENAGAVFTSVLANVSRVNGFATVELDRFRWAAAADTAAARPFQIIPAPTPVVTEPEAALRFPLVVVMFPLGVTMLPVEPTKNTDAPPLTWISIGIPVNPLGALIPRIVPAVFHVVGAVP